MIIDLATEPLAPVTSDVLVIGSGAAGLVLSLALEAAGVSVTVLESGGLDVEPEAQELNLVDAAGLCFDGATEGRARAIGGSTNRWGGQLLPLEPIDFAARDWVRHSGWPFDERTLEPYYRDALEFSGVDTANFDSDICAGLGLPEDPLANGPLRYFFSKWSPAPRFRDTHLDHLRDSDSLRLFVHATVTQLELGGGQAVERVRVVDSAGRAHLFRADAVVLCTGGIETPRLLLTSGIGNEHVGHFLQDHPSLLMATVTTDDLPGLQRLVGPAEFHGYGVTPRFALRPEFQAAEQVLNASVHFSFAYPRTMLRRHTAINLARGAAAGTGGVRDAFDAVGRLAGPTLRMRRAAKRVGADAQVAVTVMTEQEPSDASRVTLSGKRDRHGVPLPRISWQMTAATWRTIGATARVLADEFERTGTGRVHPFPHVTATPRYWAAFPHDMYHHMGATRMAESPAHGVVDENCRVFGVDNLFIASGSVFPTGGHSNCTLTIMALARRLADHLSGERSTTTENARAAG